MKGPAASRLAVAGRGRRGARHRLVEQRGLHRRAGHDLADGQRSEHRRQRIEQPLVDRIGNPFRPGEQVGSRVVMDGIGCHATMP